MRCSPGGYGTASQLQREYTCSNANALSFAGPDSYHHRNRFTRSDPCTRAVGDDRTDSDINT
jgi:hypothetical protein